MSHLRLPGSLSVASYESQELRWKYSNAPPHGVNAYFEVEVTLRLTVSQPVCLGVEPNSGLATRYLLSCLCWAPSLTRLNTVCSFEIVPDRKRCVSIAASNRLVLLMGGGIGEHNCTAWRERTRRFKCYQQVVHCSLNSPVTQD
jgi:hypothetical protein